MKIFCSGLKCAITLVHAKPADSYTRETFLFCDGSESLFLSKLAMDPAGRYGDQNLDPPLDRSSHCLLTEIISSPGEDSASPACRLGTASLVVHQCITRGCVLGDTPVVPLTLCRDFLGPAPGRVWSMGLCAVPQNWSHHLNWSV